MIIHVCSHFGDIELLPGSDGDTSRIRYFKLTPAERRILNEFLVQYTTDIEIKLGDEGDIEVPLSMWEVGGIIGGKMHGGRKLLSAVKFTDGNIQVSQGSVWDWFKGMGSRLHNAVLGGPEAPAVGGAAAAQPKPALPVPVPAAAVQTRMPPRGCPMPSVTDLREQKAAQVVAKFLTGQQREDFRKRRAFIAVGGDTGRLYRVTSRWAPSVQKYGVLYDMSRKRSICAHDTLVPPSEEVLAMKFSIEQYEKTFLSQPHG